MDEQLSDERRPMTRWWVLIAESMCNRTAQVIVTFTTLLVATLGYGTALLILACAQLKLLYPDRVGVTCTPVPSRQHEFTTHNMPVRPPSASDARTYFSTKARSIT